MPASALIAPLEDLARAAGATILDVYRGDFEVFKKDDASPVTEADRRAEAIILPGLAQLTPGTPVVAEEEVAAGRTPEIAGESFWLVDPLDGTKEFIQRNGEFTVNIALIERGIPVVGIVFAPALNLLWSAAGPGTAQSVDAAGRRLAIACRPAPVEGPVVVTSRSHRDSARTEQWMAGLKRPIVEFAGSSLKFCRVAEGSADFYPRFGPTSEWDVAAGHAILLAAGGEVVTLEGDTLTYRKPRFLNPDFLARART